MENAFMPTAARTMLTSLLLLCMLVGGALGADPKLTTIVPRGAQRGTEVAAEIIGVRLSDTVDLVFYSRGIEVREIEATSDTKVRVVLAITPDCAPGLHAFRVLTKSGISNLRTLSVGTLPESSEVEPNNSLESAQQVVLGITVNGLMRSEDVDYYAFDAKAGQTVVAEIEGIRLGDVLFDPFIAVLDSAGFTLGSSDDHPLLHQDAFVAAMIPADGRYYVQVRESAYRGNDRSRYRLHIGIMPRPGGALPLGAAAGSDFEVAWIGPASRARSKLTMREIDEQTESFLGWAPAGVVGLMAQGEFGFAPSPNRFRMRPLGIAAEIEPNNDVASGTLVSVPVAIEGVIEAPGDRDVFVFDAKKGQVFRIEAYARRLGSPIDTVVSVRDMTGRVLKNNDDAGGPDSRFDFKAPEDARYAIVVRDHLGKGGQSFFYRVEVAPIEPQVTVHGTRTRQAVAVARGNRAMILLTAERKDFDGPLTVLAENLPSGVSIHVPEVPSGVSAIPVVFAADAGAEPGHALSDWTVSHADASRAIVGGFRQDIEQVLGRNNIVFWAHTVERLPVAVVEEAPFSIEARVSQAPLVQKGSATIHVVAQRQDGFDKPIRLSLPFLPPGVGANQSVVIAAGETEANIPINAGGRSRIGDWQIVVEAKAATGHGEMVVSSDLELLHVSKPFVAFRPQAASVERGQETQMFIELDRLDGFTGKATVTLGALPHKVTAEPLELTAETTSLTFTIKTQPESPVGRHKGVFCVARFETEAGVVVHRLPAGALIIQNPPPAPRAESTKPAPRPEPKAKPEPGEKPLTRLQKLRRRHASEHQKHDAEKSDGDDLQGGD
jgi:Bacterial pre-peptidase C-terminal domain